VCNDIDLLFPSRYKFAFAYSKPAAMLRKLHKKKGVIKKERQGEKNEQGM